MQPGGTLSHPACPAACALCLPRPALLLWETGVGSCWVLYLSASVTEDLLSGVQSTFPGLAVHHGCSCGRWAGSLRTLAAGQPTQRVRIPGAAMTQCHRPGISKVGNGLSHSPGGWTSRVMLPAELTPSQGAKGLFQAFSWLLVVPWQSSVSLGQQKHHPNLSFSFLCVFCVQMSPF